MSGGCLHVVAGVLDDGQGRVLIAQRPAGRHLAGGWEFPGGKLQAGESREQALQRELHEELGIQVHACRPLIRLKHRYPERAILLDVWRVQHFDGEPEGLDGQSLRWCRIADLPQAQLLPADVPVITALQLPGRIERREGAGYLLMSLEELLRSRRDTHRLAGALCQSAQQAQAAAHAGAQFIVMTHSLALPALKDLCEQVNLPVFAAGLEPAAAWQAGAVGIADAAALQAGRGEG